MLTGTDLFDQVDERLSRADRDARAAQSEVEALTARRDQARAAEAEALRALAGLRLQALRDGATTLGQLDAAEEAARRLLADRAQTLRAAEMQLARGRDAVAAAQAERERRVTALRAAEATHKAALDTARARAAQDREWQALRSQADEAARVAAHAAEKAKLAHADLAAKGKPYRDDPLFTYLWDRGWGTPGYRPGIGLTRLLDGWAARVAGFETARRGYALLSELPLRLDEHAARMRDAASRALAALAEAEQRIAGLPPRDPALHAAQDALDMAEQALESARAAAASAERAQARLGAGQDETMRQAEAKIEAALANADLLSLREAARRSPTSDDDAIVARLEAAAAARIAAERGLPAATASAEQARRRREEIETLRAEMRSRGYGRDQWDFKDGGLIGVLISELLRGALSRDGFWDRMAEHRRRNPWGEPPMPTPPQRERDGGLAWPIPGPWGQDGGGFGGGGFKTGGTMEGGGGFRTGGSF
jgi:hypothetical protein